MTVGREDNIDQLSQIYWELNETGREKLGQVSKQILKIWNTVNEGKTVSNDRNLDDLNIGD